MVSMEILISREINYNHLSEQLSFMANTNYHILLQNELKTDKNIQNELKTERENVF